MTDEGVNGNTSVGCVTLALFNLIGDEALDVLLILLIKVSNSSTIEIDENAWLEDAIGLSVCLSPGSRTERSAGGPLRMPLPLKKARTEKWNSGKNNKNAQKRGKRQREPRKKRKERKQYLENSRCEI